MSIDSIVSRLHKVNEDLMTISSLRKLKMNVPGKSTKACKCPHHGLTPRSRCPRKRNSHDSRDKSARCCCRQPKLCLCKHTTDDQSIIESSKISDADDDTKSHSHHSMHADPQKEVTVRIGKTNIVDRPEQKILTVGTSNDNVSKISIHSESRIVGRSDNEFDSKQSEVASQTLDVVNQIQTFDAVKSKEDEMNIEQLHKELMIEKMRNRELEEKLEKMNCSLQCLKDESKEQSACLRDSLDTAKNRAKLASHSKKLAINLAKEAKEQADLARASIDEHLDRLNAVKSENSKLQCECEELRGKLRVISESEGKKCAEVDDKVNRIKCALRQKEITLAREKCELEKTVNELTKHIEIQKKRICDLTSICTKQREALHQHQICISTKVAQLSEAEDKFQSMSCQCVNLNDEIEELKCRLNEEMEARCKLERALEERKDDCYCELQIKDKIIDDQVETIKKFKKLLQDSEQMAHQAAREFESLRDELYCLKQSNKSLQQALEEAESQINDERDCDFCERCNILEDQIRNINQQKQKALLAAKCTAEKLFDTTMNFQRQIDCEKQRNRFVANLVERKNAEIELLKNEIMHIEQFRNRRTNDYVGQ